MSDKEFNAQKARVLKVYDRWAGPMGIRWFEVKHIWQRQMKDGAQGENANSGTAAEVTTDWRYRIAAITWFLPDIARLEDPELERIVVHELVHILLDPIWHNAPEELRDEMELTAQTLAIGYIWVREAGQSDKKAENKKIATTSK